MLSNQAFVSEFHASLKIVNFGLFRGLNQTYFLYDHCTITISVIKSLRYQGKKKRTEKNVLRTKESNVENRKSGKKASNIFLNFPANLSPFQA